MQRAKEILDYWFGPPESPEYGERRTIWFQDGRMIDAEVRERFLTHHEAAAGGAFDHWREDARACLALILLFDQFPRHMFRDRPRAYATDQLALAVAKHALEAGYHLGRPVVELTFFHLPFEHAEDLAEVVQGCLSEIRTDLRRTEISLSAEALRLVEVQRWPGNELELKSVLRRAAVLSSEVVLGVGAIEVALDEQLASVARIRKLEKARERDRLIAALSEAGGAVSKASRLLGTNRSAVYRLMDKHGIPRGRRK